MLKIRLFRIKLGKLPQLLGVKEMSSGFSIREAPKLQNRNDSFSYYLSGFSCSHIDWRNAVNAAIINDKRAVE